MDKKELIRVGRHIFGNRWKAPLARLIGVKRETVSRWASGKQSVSIPLAKAIALLYKQVPTKLPERRYNAKGKEVKIGDAYLIHGNSREILNQIESSINVILTDPVWPKPLPCLAGSNEPEDLLTDVISCAVAKLKNLSIIVQLGCDSDPRILLSIPPQLPFFRITWLPYAVPSKKGRVLLSGDVAYVFGKAPKPRPGNHLLPGQIHSDFCPPASSDMQKHGIRTIHPCPRNLTHVEWLIEKFTEPADVILDPFMGSGTTAIAALKRGRKFIGIEIERKYWDEAKRRISQECSV